MKPQFIIVGLLSLLLAACSVEQENAGSTSSTAAVESSPANVKPWYDFSQVSAGARVYQENCAACHGSRGEGAVNWRQPGADGKYPAPPLNGTGHAWHHPLNMLYHTIRNGSPGGQGNMPAWAGKLSDEEIVSVIAWFQSKWPREIYHAWLKRDAASRAARG
ncbi:MAG: cytochrome c [Sedimenticola sp.]|nr:cytochrome c [Sedimenticola sp.]